MTSRPNAPTHIVKKHDWTDEMTMYCGRHWEKDWLLMLICTGQVSISYGYRYWSRNARRKPTVYCQSCVKAIEKEQKRWS